MRESSGWSVSLGMLAFSSSDLFELSSPYMRESSGWSVSLGMLAFSSSDSFKLSSPYMRESSGWSISLGILAFSLSDSFELSSPYMRESSGWSVSTVEAEFCWSTGGDLWAMMQHTLISVNWWALLTLCTAQDISSEKLSVLYSYL